MLDGLRRIGRTWFGKVLGAFLLVGLAGFGISNVILDFGTSTVAKVGDEDITARDFSRAYSDTVNRYAAQQGRIPTTEEAFIMRLPDATIQGLAAQAAVNQLGAQLGLGVSEDRLGQMLRDDPSFAGTLGTFERANFQTVLRRSGMTEGEYFDLQRKTARRNQLMAGLFADAPVPDVAKELLARYSGDTRALDYVIVNAQSIPPVAEVTEEEMAQYLADNQARFQTAETRTIDLLQLTHQVLAEGQEVSEDEIAAEYERTKDSRVRIEKRTIRWAALTAEAQAQFELGQTAGKSFDEIVAETGVEVSELGTLTRSQLTDAALGDAAFGLEVGQFVLIPGIGGQRAVNVSAIEPGGEITLEEARDEIAQSLALARARADYVDVLDQVEELRAAFRPLREIAERFGLEVREVSVTRSGEELIAVPSIPAQERPRIAAAAFTAEVGELTPTITSGSSSNIFIDLKSIEPARDQTLDEVVGEVASALIDERTTAAIREKADEIVKRVEAGEPLSDVAFELNLIPAFAAGVSRSGDGTEVINSTVAAAAFAGGLGHVGSALNGEGDHLVFQVADVTPGEPDAIPGSGDYLAEATRQSLFGELVAGVTRDVGVRVNQQAINQLLALEQ